MTVEGAGEGRSRAAPRGAPARADAVPRGVERRRLLDLLGPPTLLIVLWAVALHHGPTSDTLINDLGLYHEDGLLLAHGHVPYREFLFEYPPLAILPMWAALLGGSEHYATAFGLLMLAVALGLQVTVRGLARPYGPFAAWAFALTPLVAGAMLRTYLDLLPVLLLCLGLLAVLRERPNLGFALLAAGTMAKGFPVVGIAVAAAWLAGRGEGRVALRGLAVAAGVVVALSLPFAGKGYVDAYRFQLERPVQIESIPASLLRIAGGSQTTGVNTPHPNRFRSNGLEGGAEPAIAAIFSVLLIATLAWIALAAARAPDERGLLLAACAATLAFVALGKVLSPQYAIWLVPWTALALAWRERLLAVLLAAAVVLTQIEFPRHYWALVAGDAGAEALVATRNTILLAALAVALHALRRSAPVRA